MKLNLIRNAHGFKFVVSRDISPIIFLDVFINALNSIFAIGGYGKHGINKTHLLQLDIR